MKITQLLIVAAVLLAACTSVSGSGVSQTSSTPPLTEDEVKDAQVNLNTLTGGVPIPYQLQDGLYQKGTDPGVESYASIQLLEQMAFGDLNGDGAGDAAALVAENYGGTGTFVSLVAFVNEKGKAVQAAILPIDDRPVVKSLALENGLLGLEATTHGLQDAMCCPSFQTRRQYQLFGSQLILRQYESQTPSGQWRTITITSPRQVQSGAQSLLISGTVSIAPFENNLSYHILDTQGNELAAGPVPVTAMDMGAPGTFQVDVPLDHISPGTTAWVALQDLSAADGSLIAMDSVEIKR
jgi:hypothetical protein